MHSSRSEKMKHFVFVLAWIQWNLFVTFAGHEIKSNRIDSPNGIDKSSVDSSPTHCQWSHRQFILLFRLLFFVSSELADSALDNEMSICLFMDSTEKKLVSLIRRRRRRRQRWDRNQKKKKKSWLVCACVHKHQRSKCHRNDRKSRFVLCRCATFVLSLFLFDCRQTNSLAFDIFLTLLCRSLWLFCSFFPFWSNASPGFEYSSSVFFFFVNLPLVTTTTSKKIKRKERTNVQTASQKITKRKRFKRDASRIKRNTNAFVENNKHNRHEKSEQRKEKKKCFKMS